MKHINFFAEKLHEAGADKIYIGRKLFTTFLMDGKLENAEKLGTFSL